MLNKLNEIEASLKNVLNNKTAAGSHVYINRFFPVNIDEDSEQDQYFIFIHYTGDNGATHRYIDGYNLTAEYDITCLAAERNNEDILLNARDFASSVQQILIQNEEKQGVYYDLQYQASSFAKDIDHTIPLIGYKLKYQLNYQAGIQN